MALAAMRELLNLLTGAGIPQRDLGLHGRISHTPAKSVYADAAWEGDEYRMWVRGKCQEAMVFAENLVLHREISARLGRAERSVRRLRERVRRQLERMQAAGE